MLDALKDKITDKQQKMIVTTLMAGLTLWIGSSLANLTWLIVAPPKVLLPTAKVTANSSGSAETSRSDIGRWHLFGVPGAEPVQEVQQEIAAPVTRLRLTLLGVFTSDEVTKSSAIISEQGKSGEYYKVGDRVQGRTKLSAVYEDKVILDTNGKLETLKFDELAAGNSITQSTAKKLPPRKSNSRSALGPNQRSRGKNRIQDKLRDIKTPEQFVGLAKETMGDNPEQTLQELGLEPADQGYKVTNRAGMLKSLGLKSGDLILSINGVSLGDISSDVDLIDQIYEEGSAEIEVQRGSRTFRINRKFK